MRKNTITRRKQSNTLYCLAIKLDWIGKKTWIGKLSQSQSQLRRRLESSRDVKGFYLFIHSHFHFLISLLQFHCISLWFSVDESFYHFERKLVFFSQTFLHFIVVFVWKGLELWNCSFFFGTVCMQDGCAESGIIFFPLRLLELGVRRKWNFFFRRVVFFLENKGRTKGFLGLVEGKGNFYGCRRELSQWELKWSVIKMERKEKKTRVKWSQKFLGTYLYPCML